MLDLVIIGGGPAGMAAAVYAKRAMLDVLVLEREPMGGGQLVYTETVDNYPGISEINGYELAVKFVEHAKKLGVRIQTGQAVAVREKETRKEVALSDGQILDTKAVIVATGARHKRLGVQGEEEYQGAGVSYCAVCDGLFFSGKDVAVVGGGDAALGYAHYLSRMCSHVYLIHRRREFRAGKSLQEKIFRTENITLVIPYRVERIEGEEAVNRVRLTNCDTGKESEIPISGIFVAVGSSPVTEFLDRVTELDEGGYIVAGEDGVTSLSGIFAAGDVRTKDFRQIVTAVSDGANAVQSVQRYLEEH